MLQLEWARGPSTTARTDFGLRAAARRDLGSCCLGICTFGMLPLGKIPLGSCHLKKILLESTLHLSKYKEISFGGVKTT